VLRVLVNLASDQPLAIWWLAHKMLSITAAAAGGAVQPAAAADAAAAFDLVLQLTGLLAATYR
jgi:hypothetical protein